MQIQAKIWTGYSSVRQVTSLHTERKLPFLREGFGLTKSLSFLREALDKFHIRILTKVDDEVELNAGLIHLVRPFQ